MFEVTRRASSKVGGLALGVLVLASVVVIPATAQEPYSAGPVTAKADAYLPQSLVDGLESSGTRLTTTSNGLAAVVCELWWAKTVTTRKPTATSKNVVYGNLQPGELVGVIHFLPETSEDYREDFRDQKLRPGYYTMRYAVIPEDNEHKDVSPYRDFVLLSPVSVDRDPQKVLSMEDLLRNSRFASRTKHPAVLSLVPPYSDRKETVAVRTDDTGSCILQVRLHTQSQKGAAGEQALAIIIVTPSKENGAS